MVGNLVGRDLDVMCMASAGGGPEARACTHCFPLLPLSTAAGATTTSPMLIV